jgi:hypothetical protein
MPIRKTKARKPTKKRASGPTQKPRTLARVRLLVVLTAKQIAKEYGATLSTAAIGRLLAPSAEYFTSREQLSVDPKQLRKELTPIVLDAIRSARRQPRTSLAGGGPPVRYYLNPLPKRRPVRAKDISLAMRRATCHFLWFC